MENADTGQSDSALVAAQRGMTLRMRDVLNDCVRRRAAGESWSDADIIAAHPDLMPGLGRELALLHLLRSAAEHASDRANGNGSSAATQPGSRSLLRPDAIPGYQLIRELHRGGQGVVYVARHESTGRDVAIKFLQRGPFASASDRARFQREIELLVRLRHPHIVAIHDSGRTGNSHYLVMDLVDGMPLDRYAESHWTAKRRARGDWNSVLKLFTHICEAVHAAHLRGVIHRDLKPGNVLVDPTGEPRVLDFGLAKDLTASSASTVTQDGQFVGSIPWASPEQIGSSNDMDVRSDVYSLGVMLYQLVTGAFPYKVTGPIAEVFQAIASSEPIRPSALEKAVDSELETIVLKCLQKAPDRRYQSAGELARDITRYCNHEPIEAKRDSTLYVIGKHLRRHRLPVAFASALLTGLIAFALYAAAQARLNRDLAQRETTARHAAENSQRLALSAQEEAEHQRDSARHARDAENAQRKAAEEAAARAENIKNFFVQTMGVANPDVSQSGGITLDTLLDRASTRVDATFSNDPASEAAVRTVIGQAYATLGYPALAREHLERAVELYEKTLETPPMQYYESLWTLMNVLADVGTQDEWRGRWWQLWRLYPRLLEVKDLGLGRVVKTLADTHFGEQYSEERSGPFYFQMLQLADTSLAANDPEWLLLADFLHLAGENLGLKFQKEAGVRVLRDALNIERRFLAETNPRVVRTCGVLTNLLLETGRNAEAESLARGALAALEQSLQPNHWYVAVQRARVAACRIGLGEFESADATLRDSLAQAEAGHGYAGRYAIEILIHLVRLHENGGRAQEAEAARLQLARRFVRSSDSMVIYRIDAVLGPQVVQLHEALKQLRFAVIAREKDLLSLAQEIRAFCRENIPPEHPLSALVSEYLYEHAKSHSNKVGFAASTRALFEEAEELAAGCPDMHPVKRALAAWWLAYDLSWNKEYEAALPLAQLANQIWDANPQVHRGRRGMGKSLYGTILSKLGRTAEAEPLLVSGFEDVFLGRGPRHADTDNALRRVIVHYRDSAEVECALPHVLSSIQHATGNTDCLHLMLEAGHPRVAGKINALKSLRYPTREKLQATIDAALTARRDEIPDDDPYAAICSDLLYSHMDNNARTDDCDLWMPIADEVVQLHARHFGPRHRKTTYALWWKGMTLLAAGNYVQAETVARSGHSIRLDSLKAEFTGGHSRFEHIICGALIGQRRFDEARAILDAVLPEYIERYGDSSFHTLELIGQSLWLRACQNKPTGESTNAVDARLRSIVETRADARPLLRLARKIVLHRGFSPSDYELALDAAKAADELNPKLPNITSTIALALHRLGRSAEALESLESSETKRNFDPDEAAAVRILASLEMGRSADAITALILHAAGRDVRPRVPRSPAAQQLLAEAMQFAPQPGSDASHER